MDTFRIIVKHPFDHLLILLISVDIFLPKIPFGSSSFLTDLIIAFVLFVPVFVCFIRVGCNKRIFYSYLILVVLHFISTIYGYFVLGVSTHPADIWNFVNEIKYLFIIWVGSLCTFDTVTDYYHRFINVGSVIIVLICLLEYFNPFGVASLIGNYYSSELHTSGMLNGSHRILATGTDPNVGASIISFFLLYRFCYYLHCRKLPDLIFSTLLLICVLFTSSRTVLAGISFSMLLFILTNKSIKITAKIWILIFVAATIIFLLPYFSYLVEGFTTFFSEEGNHSFNKRLKVWEYLFERIKLSPIIGWGVAESVIDGFPVDGEYIFTLFRYGIIGLVGYLFINIKFLFLIKKEDLSTSKLLFYKEYLSLVFITSLFIMVTNNFYLGKQLFQVYIAVLSFFCSGIYSQKQEKGLYSSRFYT